MTVEETIRNAFKIIKSNLPDSEVYLFGSRARGTPQKYSDIDIAIRNKNKISSSEIIDLRNKLENLKTMFEVQMVDIESSSERFKKGVMAYAKKLDYKL